MRLNTTESTVSVWLSARDTYYWADGNWPCSTLSDRRLFAAFDNTGLVGLTINGRDDVDVDSHELSAIVADHLRDRLPQDHPLYLTLVGLHTED